MEEQRDPTPPWPPEPARWIVIGTQTRGGDLCNQALSLLPGWTVLLFGAHKIGVSHSRCVFLPPSELTQFGRSIGVSDYNVNSSELAYLYAIKNGAQAIYVPPRQGLPISKDGPMTHTAAIFKGLVYLNMDEQDIINPSWHFGCGGRGAAADNPEARRGAGFDLPVRKYKLCNLPAPPIQAPIDFHAASSHTTSRKQLAQCDNAAPPIIIPDNYFVKDVNLYGALYLPNAFWALPIYGEENSQVHNAAWTFIVQKLLWRQTAKLLVWHNVFNAEVLHNRVDSGEMETDENHLKIQEMVMALREWHCKEHSYRCAVDIATHFASQNIMDEDFPPTLSRWFNALKIINYNLQEVNVTEACNKEPVLYHSLNYNQPLPKKRGATKELYKPVVNYNASRQLLLRNCKAIAEIPHDIKINLTAPWQQRGDILLIVIFNKPHYEALPYVEALYRPFFPYMIYCGPGLPSTTDFPKLRQYNYNFVSYGGTPEKHFPGAFNYKCVSMAIQMHFNIKGYFAIADDILLAMQRILHLPGQNIWFLPKTDIRIGEVTKLRECKLGMCDFFPHWRWWEDYQREVLSILSRLQRDKHNSLVLYQCQKQLQEWTGSSKRALGGYSDVYYVPRRLQDEFELLASMFLEEGVFLEIAVPTILGCIESWDEIPNMVGSTIWSLSRDTPWAYFNRRTMLHKAYMHPTKWGYLANQINDQYRTFFCNDVVPFLHDRYGRYFRD